MQAAHYLYEALIEAGVKPENARRVEQGFESDSKQIHGEIDVVKAQVQTTVLDVKTQTQAVAQNDERQRSKAEYTTSQLFGELKLMRTEMKTDKAESKAEIEKVRGEVEKIRSEIEKVRSEMKVDKAESKAEIEKVRSEISSVKNELSKQIADAQRWTITAMFAGLGALAILQKFL